MEKLIDLGFQCIWNEEEKIRGWAKTMLYFCKRICAIVDPKTSDDTVKILKEEFPEVEIFWQDRSLGDSDYTTKGEKGHLIMHGNNTKFIKEQSKTGDWILFLAADERFHPDDFEKLKDEIRYANIHGLEALVHKEMLEFHKKGYYVDFPFTGSQFRFFKRPKVWIQNLGVHCGKSWYPKRIRRIKIPLYHFTYNRGDLINTCWAYQSEASSYSDLMRKRGKITMKKYEGPMFDNWKNLD